MCYYRARAHAQTHSRGVESRSSKGFESGADTAPEAAEGLTTDRRKEID